MHLVRAEDRLDPLSPAKARQDLPGPTGTAGLAPTTRPIRGCKRAPRRALRPDAHRGLGAGLSSPSR
eukprot:11720904-Alexandrium_andersonii.AAC.1